MNVIRYAALLVLFSISSGVRLVAVDRASRLQGDVVDDQTGKPLAACVCVQNSHGKTLEIDGVHSHVEYLGKRWCYVDGRFSIGVPGALAVYRSLLPDDAR